MWKELFYRTWQVRSAVFDVGVNVTSAMTLGFSVSIGTRYGSVGLNLLFIHFDACVWKRDNDDNKLYWP